MRRLSSVTTVWQKRLFPVPVLIAAGAMAYMAVAHPLPAAQAWLPWAAVVAIAVVTILVYRYRLADLADEVWLSGDDLVVHRHGEQARIALANVTGVESSRLANPPRVVVTLDRDSRFGRRFAFMPARPAFGFGRSPIADELRQRVAAVHRTAGG